MKADLTKTATLGSMTKLIDRSGMAEAPGSEPETHPNKFAGRNGYDQDFLSGWPIKLPEPKTLTDVTTISNGGSGHILTYQNFSIIMSKSRRMALLTAVNINGEKSVKVRRINSWSFDGRLKRDEQWGDEIYFNNELDRGHMVRREDPVWGSEATTANIDTFHFTNSCPQMAGVNQKTWVGLENYVLSHARADGMKVTVFTGPYFNDNDMQYRNALIPSAFWKVVAIVKDDGTPSATAYKVSQEKELSDLEFVYAGYKTFQISIRSVIRDTNIDFGLLEPYDGFSQHERMNNTEVVEKLEGPESIRI
jgi:endonuclease G